MMGHIPVQPLDWVTLLAYRTERNPSLEDAL